MVVHAPEPKLMIGQPSTHGGPPSSDAALGDAFRNGTAHNDSGADDSEEDEPEWLDVAVQQLDAMIDAGDNASGASGASSAHTPSPVHMHATTGTDADKPTLDTVEIIVAADSTGSMSTPIKYGKKLIDALVSYLAGIVDSGQFSELEVVIHLIGLNDWKAGDMCTPPVKIFLNEEESIRQRRAVGYSFTLDTSDADTWRSNLEIVSAAVDAMADSTRTSGHHGGDAREEYGTGLHFVKTLVEQSQQRNQNQDRTVKYFMLAITDDMQHGMGPDCSSISSGDLWPSGVTTASVYGPGDRYAHEYSCPYAPDTHAHGFPIWKPHSFWTNLNGVLGLGVTVVWAAIGNSAEAHLRNAYSSWLGTLSTVFNYSSGVLLSWHKDDANKPVPATVVHLLNTLITSASISDELDEERKRELALSKTEALMTSAKKHSQRTNGPLQNVPTTIEDAAKALDQLVINTALKVAQQAVFVGRVPPSAANGAVYRSITAAAEAGDTGEADRAMAVAYRSLAAECTPPSKTHPVHASPPPAPPRTRSIGRSLSDVAPPPTKHACRSLVSDDDDDDAFCSVPTYRSMHCAPYHGACDDDGMEEPSYRSLGCNGDAIPCLLPETTFGEETEAPPSSVTRLMRLATNTTTGVVA